MTILGAFLALDCENQPSLQALGNANLWPLWVCTDADSKLVPSWWGQSARVRDLDFLPANQQNFAGRFLCHSNKPTIDNHYLRRRQSLAMNQSSFGPTIDEYLRKAPDAG